MSAGIVESMDGFQERFVTGFFNILQQNRAKEPDSDNLSASTTYMTAQEPDSSCSLLSILRTLSRPSRRGSGATGARFMLTPLHPRTLS